MPETLTDTVDRLAARHAATRGALLPLLHDLQAELGWVSDAAVAAVAHALNLSRAEVHGVVTFYHDFRRTPPPRHIVKLCRAEACQARGGRAVEAALAGRLGVTLDEPRGDGAVAVESVYCLGLCAIGPAALVNGAPVAAIDGAKIEAIAAQVAA